MPRGSGKKRYDSSGAVRVLAVDPGGTTGWVLGLVHPSTVVEIIRWGEDPSWLDFTELVDGWLGASPPWVDALVCERWVPRPGVRTWEPDAVYLIGALTWLAFDADVPFTLQSVGDATRWGTASKVEPYRTPEHGGVGHGGKGHALMALRHLLLHARSSGVTTGPPRHLHLQEG